MLSIFHILPRYIMRLFMFISEILYYSTLFVFSFHIYILESGRKLLIKKRNERERERERDSDLFFYKMI